MNIKDYKKNADIFKILKSRRSIRRFKQTPIEADLLMDIVDAGRLAPSAANLQPIAYVIVNDKKLCSEIFETIGWAAYIKPTWKPDKKERPVAYIVLLVSDVKNLYYQRDVSLSAENIIIAAEANTIGSCLICNIDKQKIRDCLNIPNSYEIDSLIALGYKAENPVIEDLTDSIKYWRDENEKLHVPKRKLKNIVHINKF